ncbi:site-specific DNA-methyltransferase [Nonomuraea angiospora]|uniref:Adenine-specific DNA-methyltransferase n=1 Tax=Nonomuraea angiospora TaxID=46172 RepID=A0ABR9M1H5_9ACTN|nr:site-specific DNA-methyltransferase [Nonomuraea angiospora]MBE1586761.1 adenine-specific DNA-methyltransferase [Nonomuraea angiospora]
MEKLRMHSPDLTERNIDKIAELFPTVITEGRDEEGNPTRAVDFDLLRQELSDHVIEGPQERYQLNWPGKREALFAANAPIAKTLRPVREESVEFDSTQNLFIEGDNLDALKLIQESYLGKIKLIYIDPPYNTGNDFVYCDDFAATTAEYLARSGQVDDEGNRLVANTESNGRFHSDWLSMMYPRVKLARTLLRTDGVFVASIDSHETHNLRKICDEVFGERNFVAEAIVIASPRGRQSDSFLAGVHDSLLIYARDRQFAKVGGLPLDEEQRGDFKFHDPELGPYRLLGLRQRGTASKRSDRPEMYFPIYVSSDGDRVSVDSEPGWHEVLPRKSDGSDGRWAWGRDRCRALNHLLVARWIERRGEYDIFTKDALFREGVERQRKFKTLWASSSFDNQNGTQETKALMGGDFMSYPKPVALMRDICLLGAPDGGIVVDLFAGSGTTAQAVLETSAIDGKPRQFLLTQLDEALPEKSPARRAGYETIAQLSRERIRRAAAKVATDAGVTVGGLDLGFRTLRVDSTNLADVLRTPDGLGQDELDLYTDSIKPGRTEEDLLFQVLLGWGLDLTMPIAIEVFDGREIFVVDDGALIACFADEVSPAVVREIAKREPLRVVFRDSGFTTDADRINAEQVFAEVSPATDVKAI